MASKMFPLWLPPQYAEASKRGLFSYITWADVSETGMSEDRLIELVSRFRTETLIILVSTIGIVLDSNPPAFTDLNRYHNLQQNLANEICTPKVAEKVGWYLQSGRRDTLAHHEQLLIVAKLAVLYGQPGPSEEIDSASVDELLLGINTMLAVDGERNPTPTDIELAVVLRYQALYRNEQDRYMIGRYFDLLATRTRSYSGPARLDLDAAFHAARGISIEQFMAFALFYRVRFYDAKAVTVLASRDYLNVLQRDENQMHDPAIRELCRQAFLSDKQDYIAAFAADTNLIARFNPVPFQARPLFRKDDGSAIPIALRFLLECCSIGAYWVLHEHFRKTDRDHGVQAFAALIGQLFQQYLTDLLSRAYSTIDGRAQRFISELQIIASSNHPKGNNPPFDGAIIGDDSLILIEMYSRALISKTLINSDREEFAAEMDRHHGGKIKGQLGLAISDISAGTWTIPDLDLQTIRHIYPVLALLHPFPQRPSALALLWDTFELDPSLAADTSTKPDYDIRFGTTIVATKVHRPQIIVAEEFEMLEPLLTSGAETLPGLLARKLADPFTAGISMKDYLLKHYSLQELDNPAMLELYNAATSSMKRILVDLVDFDSEARNDADSASEGSSTDSPM